MNNDWYRLDLSITDNDKQKNIDDLKRIINELFTNPDFCNEVMIFSPKKEGLKFSPVWFIPPKTINLMLEKTLILCGAEKCAQPEIDKVSVSIGEEQNIHDFFSNKK